MEWLAVSIGIGLIISLLFTEAFGLSVGGMIVPGYMAIHFDQPLTIAATLAVALLTYGVIRLVNRWAILFGRRRVVVTMLVGFAIASVTRAALGSMSGHGMVAEQWVWGVTVVGFVIPGLIALWVERTGVVQTVAPLVVASCLVRLALVVIGIETVT